MKTLPLSVELSSLALEVPNQPMTPAEWVGKVKNALLHRADVLGNFTSSRLHRQRKLGADLHLNEYRIDFEKHSLFFELVRFQPRGGWEVKGFKFV
jgi:hypothetical protein